MEQARALAAQLAGTVTDPRVLDAVARVPRHRFVPAAERHRAYENVALPIACGQTISQPVVVARMLELLELAPDRPGARRRHRLGISRRAARRCSPRTSGRSSATPR